MPKRTPIRHPRRSLSGIQVGFCMKNPCVYILANKPNGTLYIGVTSDLVSRCWQHQHEVVEGFTKSHGVKLLVYYEINATMAAAINREKQLKKWNRAWKFSLIEKSNPQWQDLWHEVI